MGLFFKKSPTDENRIQNHGRWPVRLTHFHFVTDYEFPATNFPEIFFVQEGTFLHETEVGTQAIREGTVLMVNPGQKHCINQPEETTLTRVRFLPEWLTLDYSIIANSPIVMSLFFDQSWYRFPREEKLHVFTTRGEAAAQVREELTYLELLLDNQRHFEPIARVSVLKLLMLLGDEHHRFWRGISEVELLPEAKHAMDHIESIIGKGLPFEPGKMPRGGYEKRAIDKAFEAVTGLSLKDYAERRRVFHAACRLLLTPAEPRHISKELGFSNIGEFNKLFESIFDISPVVYREKFGESLPEKAKGEGEEEA